MVIQRIAFAAAVAIPVILTQAPGPAWASPGQTENQPGSDVVDSQIGRTAVTTFVGFVGRQISRFGGNLGGAILTVELPDDARGQRGAAAGDEIDRMAGWVNFSDTDIEDNHIPTRFDGDIRTYLVGLDYQVEPEILAGVAFGLERGEFATQFNGGTITTRGKTISPYASYRLDDQWSFDGILGYTRGDLDQVRGAAITSDSDFHRYFAQVSANYVTDVPAVDNMLLAGQLGYTYAFEKINGFTESNGNGVASNSNPLGQVQLSGRVGYSLFDIADGWVFHPYTGLRMLFETQSSNIAVGAGQAEHPNDQHEGQFSLGVDFFSGAKLSGNLEFTRSFARTKVTSSVIAVNLRWAFGPAE
ncbi:MAG: autotransporter outer membrane beta-barrel domain-containing protein [Alphaproteobacteria bacterium]|nr:autotransporter outer membrane beta-barrel domain-containing protein [Alphaproteobacteria bacterium]